ncbi:MAG: hypothetical protein ACK5CM_14925 [Pseudanabaena sp.]
MKLQVKKYSNLISELQSRLNLNQTELAKKVGISYPILRLVDGAMGITNRHRWRSLC